MPTKMNKFIKKKFHSPFCTCIAQTINYLDYQVSLWINKLHSFKQEWLFYPNYIKESKSCFGLAAILYLSVYRLHY